MNIEIKPIKNERDYRKALKEIDGLMDAWANTPAEGDRLNVLEAWEEKHWPIDLPDPLVIRAIAQRVRVKSICGW